MNKNYTVVEYRVYCYYNSINNMLNYMLAARYFLTKISSLKKHNTFFINFLELFGNNEMKNNEKYDGCPIQI